MRLNAIQTLIILLAITVGTVITRFLPPILFPHGKPLPKFLQELCTLLPPAMMGLLLVYSLRNVSFVSAGQWLPECIAIAVTCGGAIPSCPSPAAPSPICCWCRWYLPDGPGYAIMGCSTALFLSHRHKEAEEMHIAICDDDSLLAAEPNGWSSPPAALAQRWTTSPSA